MGVSRDLLPKSRVTQRCVYSLAIAAMLWFMGMSIWYQGQATTAATKSANSAALSSVIFKTKSTPTAGYAIELGKLRDRLTRRDVLDPEIAQDIQRASVSGITPSELHTIAIGNLAKSRAQLRQQQSFLQGMTAFGLAAALLGTGALISLLATRGIYRDREIDSAKEAVEQGLLTMGLMQAEIDQLNHRIQNLYAENTSHEIDLEDLRLIQAATLKRHQTLLSNLPVAYIAVNEHSHVMEWNEAAEELFGLKGYEVLDRSIWDTFLSSERESTARSMVSLAFLGETVRPTNFVVSDAAGNLRNTVWTIAPLLDAAGLVHSLTFLFVDQTATAHAVEAKDQSSCLLEGMLQCADLMAFVVESKSDQVQFASQEMLSWLGVSQEEAASIGALDDRIHPDMLAQYARREPKFRCKIQRQKGDWEWVEINLLKVDGSDRHIGVIKPIAEQLQLESAFAALDTRWRALAEQFESIVIATPSGRVVEKTGNPIIAGIEKGIDLTTLLDWEAAKVHGEITLAGQKILVHKMGSEDAGFLLLPTTVAEPQTFIKQLEDQLVAAQGRWENLATIDRLTGLQNHPEIIQSLLHTLETSGDEVCSALIVDLDNFHKFNRATSYQNGEDALKIVSHLLKLELSETSIAGRLSGQEFLVILPEERSDRAIEIADQIRTSIECYSWREQPLTVSIAATTFDPRVATAEDIIANLRSAMTQAKRMGRNCTVHTGDLNDPLAA